MLLKIKSILKVFLNKISENIISGKSFRIIKECSYNQHNKYNSIPSEMLKKGKEQREKKKKDTSHQVSSLYSRERRIFRSDHDSSKWVRPGNFRPAKLLRRDVKKPRIQFCEKH